MNQASSVSDAQLKVAQDGDLDPLIKLLRSEADDVRELAARAINGLTMANGVDVTFKTPEAFAPLTQLLALKNEEARSKAVWSMAILASSDANQKIVISALGWEKIITLISDYTVEVQCGGVTLLGNLALIDENRAKIIKLNVVPTLMRLLKHTRDIIVKRAVVTALSNIVDADNALEVMDDETLDLLLYVLDKSDDERVLSGVVHTISNIANAEDDVFNKRIVRKGLDRLVHLLRNPNDVIKKGVVMGLNGLTGELSLQEEVMRSGAARKMLDMLERSTDTELQLGIVLCLNNLAQNERNGDELKDLGLCEIVKGVADITTDPDIKRECSEALTGVGPSSVRSPGWVTRHKKRREKYQKPKPRNPIKDNVLKIIQVLIDDPRNQTRLRESGVIPHLISLLAEEQEDEQLKALALDALTMLSINNAVNQNEIATASQSIGLIFIEQLAKPVKTSPLVALRAIRAIGALAWKNKLVQGMFEERDIISSLIPLVETYDTNLKKVTLTTIACLADDNQFIQNEIHTKRGDYMITKLLMRDSLHESLIAAAAQAIAAITKHNPVSQEVCSRAIEKLIILLENVTKLVDSTEDDKITEEQLTGALLEVARNNKKNASAMWKLGVSESLVSVANSVKASPIAHYNALALLFEFKNSEKKLAKLRKHNGIRRAVQSLSASRDAIVRDAAVRLQTALK